ncbi:hypothetical protein FRB99_008209 [Tulasnella sp. 403]|nr:hypothetical protein FRB99_008209 [Tulasnella sp. 403]
MSHDKPIPISTTTSGAFVAPTPQNTPLVSAPIAGGLSRPTVPDIAEGKESSSEEENSVDDDDEADPQDKLSAAMLELVQGKLAGLLGKSSGYIETLPVSVRRRIEGLKGVHTGYTKLEAEYKKELLDLDRKYLALYKPVFERRHAILSGSAEPTDDEIKSGEEQSLKDNPEVELPSKLTADPKAEDPKGIPEFWLTALRNHLHISNAITERDESALRSLTDIRLAYLQDKPGYIITFHFSPNDFFTDEDELGYGGDYVYARAEGCTIHWKEDKDLTKTLEMRKQRNKNTNRTRIVKKLKKTPSFFDFFSPPAPPESNPEQELEDEEMEELEFKLELDYEMGEDLKERVIPRAIDYFTGKALEYDMDDAEDDDDDDGDDDDGDEEDESSDDGGYVRPKKKGGKGGAGGKGDQDCKAQ